LCQKKKKKKKKKKTNCEGWDSTTEQPAPVYPSLVTVPRRYTSSWKKQKLQQTTICVSGESKATNLTTYLSEVLVIATAKMYSTFNTVSNLRFPEDLRCCGASCSVCFNIIFQL
jgi:hypothetical protein